MRATIDTLSSTTATQIVSFFSSINTIGFDTDCDKQTSTMMLLTKLLASGRAVIYLPTSPSSSSRRHGTKPQTCLFLSLSLWVGVMACTVVFGAQPSEGRGRFRYIISICDALHRGYICIS